MPAHLSGQDIFLILVALVLAVALIISGLLKDMENDKLCSECAVCAQKRKQRAADKAEAKVAGFIKGGYCPKCRWPLLKGHCEMCNKDWR